MKMTMKEFFELAQSGGKYEVNTPQGWKQIGDLYLKKQKKCYILTLVGISLKCSFDHLVMTKQGWKTVESLDIKTDKVETTDGFKQILSNEFVGVEDTYDWEVLSNEHAYYANGIVSHNTGKTSAAKQFRNRPVEWRGKKYDGYDVRDVPVAQFEEMGDLHGMPMRCCLMKSKENEDRWVPEEHINEYKQEGWSLDTNTRPVTKMAPPDWVPSHPGPSILLLDDWNRSSIRIIKGIMQLLQNYGMVSWKLPPGCNIVLTGNPDEQDYQVTSIDNAILTRIKHVTLKTDATEWAVWATSQKLDPRGINWMLYYPEAMTPAGEAKRTNPRTLAEFFRVLKHFPNHETSKKNIQLHASSLIDSETFAAFYTYLARDVEINMLSPEQILNGDKKTQEHVEKLMSRKEPRLDIINIMCERLYAHIVQADVEPDKTKIANFQNFVTMAAIPDDTRHSLCRRIAKKRDNPNMHRWLIGSKELRDLIMETMRES